MVGSRSSEAGVSEEVVLPVLGHTSLLCAPTLYMTLIGLADEVLSLSPPFLPFPPSSKLITSQGPLIPPWDGGRKLGPAQTYP